MVINYRHMQEKQTTEDGAEKATGSPPRYSAWRSALSTPTKNHWNYREKPGRMNGETRMAMYHAEQVQEPVLPECRCLK